MSFFAGKKILITGINGFMGSHLAYALHERGARVQGTSRTPEHTPYLNAFFPTGTIPVHALNLRDPKSVERLLAGNEYDCIFHLASQSDSWNSTTIPLETFETNVNGTLYLLDALRRAKRKTPLVIAGSVRAFEPLTGAKVDVMAPLHPYDASKFCMQVVALSYFHAYGLPGAIAQNTNVYGPNDRNFNRLIPRVMRGLCTDGKIALKGDGRISRDFLYVKDAVNGMLAIAERLPQSSVSGKSFTFASGNLHSIREITQRIAPIFPSAKIEFDGKSFEDRDHPVLDATETQRVLDWKPVVSLENGLKETADWYRDYFSKKGGM